MPRTGLFAATALIAAALLSGCSATPTAVPAAPAKTTASAPVGSAAPDSSPSTTPTPTESPVAAPVTVAPKETEVPEAKMTPEQKFLSVAGPDIRGWGVDVTDDQLLSAGKYACEQLAAGGSWKEIEALVGADKAPNQDLAKHASELLCP